LERLTGIGRAARRILARLDEDLPQQGGDAHPRHRRSPALAVRTLGHFSQVDMECRDRLNRDVLEDAPAVRASMLWPAMTLLFPGGDRTTRVPAARTTGRSFESR